VVSAKEVFPDLGPGYAEPDFTSPEDLAMTRFALVLFGLAAAAGFSAAAEEKYVKIVHVQTGKVLGVIDNSTDGGARTVLAKDDDKEEALQWKIEKDGDHVKIVNRKSGFVLDVNENSGDEDADIIQYEAKGEDNDNQRWSWDGKDDSKRLKSKSSGLVVAPGEGKLVQKKADETKKDQLWKVVPVM
jgi:hypothetical protein